MPELTYIIPAHNSAHFIERTIRSIIEQPGGRPKVIVVDDGSTDDTMSIIYSYKSELTLLRQSNRGPSAARNFGLQVVDTEIVCFVDADDYVIGPHRRSVEQGWNENVDMLIGLAAEGNDSWISLSNRNKYGSDATSYTLLREFLCDNCVQTSTICWSTVFLRKIGGWDEALFQMTDTELAIRAFLYSARVMISQTPGWVVWHRHFDQMSQKLNARLVACQLCGHRKLIALIEKTGDRDILLLFFQRCISLGRNLYLNGYRREAIEIMSIAWNRGYLEYNGPLLEKVFARYLGITATLSVRRFIHEIKRAALSKERKGQSV
jgi:glycosyltransferase involved in cell wall biosynthesis